MTGFDEVAHGIHVLRHPVLDVNVTLVVGDDEALVVDTLSTLRQGEHLLTEVRRITSAPLRVVNTHHHFDHCFGNAAFARAGAPVLGHTSAAALLGEQGERQRARWHTLWADEQPDLAADLAATPITRPDRTLAARTTLEIGGRTVLLVHYGRAHTAGDLVVLVPDAALVVAGDIVEEGGPPQFDDGYPVQWPDALAELLAEAPTGATVVPGHGSVVGLPFVAAQHAELAELAWLIRAGHADGAPMAAVAARALYDRETATTAVRRGYAELAGAQ